MCEVFLCNPVLMWACPQMASPGPANPPGQAIQRGRTACADVAGSPPLNSTALDAWLGALPAGPLGHGQGPGEGAV